MVALVVTVAAQTPIVLLLTYFLLAILASNALLATATWLAFLALGLDQAGVPGIAAGVLHFVP